MYKTDVTERVAKETGYSENAVREVINATLDTITKALKAGDDVVLTGFGTFSTTPYQGRKVTLPSGEVVKAPKHTIAHFKAGKLLKKAVYKVKK